MKQEKNQENVGEAKNIKHFKKEGCFSQISVIGGWIYTCRFSMMIRLKAIYNHT